MDRHPKMLKWLWRMPSALIHLLSLVSSEIASPYLTAYQHHSSNYIHTPTSTMYYVALLRSLVSVTMPSSYSLFFRFVPEAELF